LLVTYISFNIFVDIYYNLSNDLEKAKNESDYFEFKITNET